MQNNQPQIRVIQDDSEFALLAKAGMEEADHVHIGINDNGQVSVYPCGTPFVWVFDLARLSDFLDRRDVAIANGSQYDFLHALVGSVKNAEAQAVEPKPEPELLRGPSIKRGETKYQEEYDRLSEQFSKAMQSIYSPEPTDQGQWGVVVTYDIDDVDTGNMSFVVTDLYDMVDRLRSLPIKNGSTFTVDLEFMVT